MIPYGRQYIDNQDREAVLKVLKSAFLTQGPAVEEFEKALCTYTGAKYALVVANGTAALHLAVMALKIKKGASGITSPITFLASANAMVYGGLRPYFADVDAQTVNISPQALSKAIRKDTKVIIPVHFAGRAADMKAIAAIARRKKCYVIEDAAHAIGSQYADGGRVGNGQYSDMTIFSFHPVKTITSGEGGAILTNDKKLYERLKFLRTHGITRDPRLMQKNEGPWYYEMQELGFNYRLTDLQAALGLSQLKKINAFIKRRQEIVAKYNRAFKNLPWLRVVSTDDINTSYHLYAVRIDFDQLKMSRKEFMEDLYKKGIGTQVHYIPVYRQPFYRKHFKVDQKDFPHAERYYAQCLSLPLYPAMKDREVAQVIATVKSIGFFKEKSNA